MSLDHQLHKLREVLGCAQDLAPYVEQVEDVELVVQDLLLASQDPHTRSVLSDMAVLTRLARVMGQGPYVRRLLSDPHAMRTLAQSLQAPPVVWPNVEMYEARLRELVSQFKGDASRALRVFKRQETLCLFAFEVLEWCSVRESSARVSDVAQVCLHVALEVACHKAGDSNLARHMCILGMGKLGGGALNYSSDVDIVFVCSDLVYADPQRRALAEQAIRHTIVLMEDHTKEGYVFRVDLRLRPEGAQGALVQCPDAMNDYYFKWGRTWERSAWVSARAIAGNMSLGQAFMLGLQPFIYRRRLDYQVIEELRQMKQMIHENAQLSAILGAPLPTEPAVKSRAPARSLNRRKHSHVPPSPPPSAEVAVSVGGWDVKIGQGGIREIEFFVRALQLVHGGTQPNVRERNTLNALGRLLFAGLLVQDDHDQLLNAYMFWRTIEHRVQMEHDRQTHRLPSSPEGMKALATRMTMGVVQLQETIESHRAHVGAMFARLFEQEAPKPSSPTLKPNIPKRLASVLSVEPEHLLHPHMYETLAAHNFLRPRQVAGQLKMLRELRHGPFSARASVAGRELSTQLLRLCAHSAQPDHAMSFVCRLVTTIGDREWFWRMLWGNPHALQLLVHVFGASETLSAMLLQEPNAIRELLGAGSAVVELDAQGIKQQLTARMRAAHSPDHRRGVAHRFQREQMLRVGLHYMGGALGVQSTTAQLSRLAQSLVEALTRELYEQLRANAQRLDWPSFVDLPFSVFAMGKLGGREIGFGSDLDVLFVYDEHSSLGAEVFVRLAQRLVRAVSSVGPAGRLYELDARLRPGGGKGPLVVSLDALRAYYTDNASLWERQALLRGRPISGPPALRRALMEVRHHVLFEQAIPSDAASQVCTMRQTMRNHLGQTPNELKHSAGGLVDVEFLVQWLQWSLGRTSMVSDPRADAEHVVQGVTSQHTQHALKAMQDDAHVMQWLGRTYPHLDLSLLSADYDTLRQLEMLIRLQSPHDALVVPSSIAAKRAIAHHLHLPDAEVLATSLGALRVRVQAAWKAVFGGS